MTTYLKKREAESFEKLISIMKRLEITDPLIFDVGANIGQSIELYRQAFPNSVIHSFEPNPQAFKILKDKWSNQENIFLHDRALHGKAGRFPFYATNAPEASSLLHPDPKLMKMSSQKKYDYQMIHVECMTLDQFCTDIGVPAIDILKLDVQGTELETLKGAIAMLDAGAVSLLYVEVNFAETYLEQMQFKDLLGFCMEHGYHLWDISPFLYTRTGRLWYSNTIFLCDRVVQILDRINE
jgi:FkbM family methyltransferase